MTKGIEFRETFGPGKCSKCGIYIEDDVRMFVAINLTGRPSLVKDQLGRATGLQPVGRRFDPYQLHQFESAGTLLLYYG